MIETIILAIVQGIAEFLPISSSGHLVIFGDQFGGLSESPSREIILHAGTLGSILVIYWRRIIKLLSDDRRVVPLLVVGTIPAGVLGIVIKTQFQWILRLPLLAGAMLIVTGVMLVVLGRMKPREDEYQSMSYRAAFMVGVFQAFAILPGISRSGSTILGGRLLGLNKEDSITFSFLLAIPAILGATVLEIKDLMDPDSVASGVNIAELVVGAIVAFVVGIVALKWLIGWSRIDRLHWFSWYCIPFGIAVVLLYSLGAS